MAGQTDGKVLIGGQIAEVNNILSEGIARLRTDGSVDAGFSAGTLFGTSVKVITLQNDGKILIAGSVRPQSGGTCPITRLNSDGSLDTNFVTGTAFSYTGVEKPCLALTI